MALKRGIRQKSPTSFEVSKTVRAAISSGDAAMLRRARPVAEREDGGARGVRLFGVTKTGLLGALGIRNGDRLESISGKKIASVPELLSAFRALGSATSWTLELARYGRPLELEYDVSPH